MKRTRGRLRRCGLLVILLLASPALASCGWWEKNVTDRVKGVVKRRLTIVSDPPGADVYVNDVYQGKSPVTLIYRITIQDVTSGLSVLLRRRGYLPMRRQVTTGMDRLSFRLVREGRKKR